MWLDQPPQTKVPPQIPLLRPKPGERVRRKLTGDPLRCFVHFASNRSWPCTGQNCCLCKKQISRRCYAYYPTEGRDGIIGILELTAQAESSLISQMEPFSHVPCGIITVARPLGKRNNPCVVQWEEPTNNKERGSGNETNKRDRGCKTLTQNEMKTALMRIWNLPPMNGTQDEYEYLETLNEVIRLKTTNQQK